MRARRATHGCSVLALALLGGCASPPAQATLDPLFSAPAGEGSYPVPAPAPRKAPEPVEPEACKHVYEPYGTHLAVDRLTGGPMLCAITICRKCGEVRHECSPPPRR